MKCCLISQIFLKGSLVFPILLFSSISALFIWEALFISLALLWKSAFIWVYLFLSPCFFFFLLSLATCKSSSDKPLCLLAFLFLWDGFGHYQCRRPGFDPWVGKIPCRREWLPTPVFWPGEFHGLCSPWGHKKSDMTEWLSLSVFLYNVTNFHPYFFRW